MWNDVERCLPENEGYYLVCRTSDKVIFHLAVSWFNPYASEGQEWDSGYWTHYWMLLPEMPVGTKGEN